jgi:hypothetical protein
MKFEVTIREEAHANILRNAQWWADHHSLNKAEEWMAEVYHQIKELRTLPERHGLAREDCDFSFELRQKLVGLGPKPSYRVLFRIVGNCVEVLTLLAAEQDDGHRNA